MNKTMQVIYLSAFYLSFENLNSRCRTMCEIKKKNQKNNKVIPQM